MVNQQKKILKLILIIMFTIFLICILYFYYPSGYNAKEEYENITNSATPTEQLSLTVTNNNIIYNPPIPSKLYFNSN